MVESRRSVVEREWEALAEGALPDGEYELAEAGMKIIRKMPRDRVAAGQRKSVARWTLRPNCINLPDAPIGHAVLDIVGDRVSLKTCSENVGGL